MQTDGSVEISSDWQAANTRFVDQSGLFVVAHVAQLTLITLWVGAFTFGSNALACFCLLCHFWHVLRAMGFDLCGVEPALNAIES
ncbi:MAG: hypothetical protein ACFB12_20120 [Leptolyngbyaceae cyanobacterium]